MNGSTFGIVAEWLGTGLQNLLQRFESARYLLKLKAAVTLEGVAAAFVVGGIRGDNYGNFIDSYVWRISPQPQGFGQAEQQAFGSPVRGVQHGVEVFFDDLFFILGEIAIRKSKGGRRGRGMRPARPGADFFAFGLGERPVDGAEVVELKFGHGGKGKEYLST